jgi:tRNA-2-methylthio-N6-dimethylallyladenosine synthase
MKYLIETHGCQMNVHDSERMAGLLEQAGYEATADDADADVIVINTCSVRERAEEKLFTRLGEIRQQGLERGARPIVAVAGCVAQQEGRQILARSSAVDVVIGTQNIKRLPMLVEQAAGRGAAAAPLVDIDPLDDVSFPLGIARRADPAKAYVTII